MRPRVYREKFKTYGLRTGAEHVEILRLLTFTMALIFAGMLFTLVTFVVKGF